MPNDAIYGQPEVLWQDDHHQFIWLGAGDPTVEQGMPSNQYMVVDHDEAFLLDPGGYEVFGRVYGNATRFVNPRKIRGIFLSHQDPDVGGAIAKWVDVAPQAEVIVSGLWARFMLHLPLREVPRLLSLPDEGVVFRLPSGDVLQFIPAHYLHSAGNFHVYDSRSRTLFSGDVGAALMEVSSGVPVVSDFDQHVGSMIDFHQRYLACNKAKNSYLDRLAALGQPIERICPQHGAIFQGDDVQRLLDWLRRIDVGVDHKGE